VVLKLIRLPALDNLFWPLPHPSRSVKTEGSLRENCFFGDKKMVTSNRGVVTLYSPTRGITMGRFVPKLLLRCALLDPVAANSEKCTGSQWAVRVGQRLQSRFGKSGAARKFGLVQIIVEASSIRGGFRNT